MTSHPGYFWPCLWLFAIALALNGVEGKLGRIADALEAQAPKPAITSTTKEPRSP